MTAHDPTDEQLDPQETPPAEAADESSPDATESPAEAPAAEATEAAEAPSEEPADAPNEEPAATDAEPEGTAEETLAAPEAVATPAAEAPSEEPTTAEAEPEGTAEETLAAPEAGATPAAEAPGEEAATAAPEAEPAPAAEVPAAPAPRPGPRPGPPKPGPRPGPGPRPPAAAPKSEPLASVDEKEAATWGRVDDDGSVFVRTADGERQVGQFAAGSPDEALAFYVRRYLTLATEVELVERRITAGTASPEEAKTSLKKVRADLTDAAAVGDLASLTTRVEALEPVLAQQREARKAERAQKQEEARVRKEAIVGEAEKLATGSDWRNGANRLRSLLDEWKLLPRLDRPTDDALWHRFSSARTAYTRARKAHFSSLDEKRGEAKAVKERLIKEAEALSSSTEWGPTAGKYRDLMTRWKEAGPAAKSEDDALWKRFRGAQDVFFGARDAANAAQDAEFEAAAKIKDALLVEAKALLPIKDLNATKRAWRDIGERWEAAGKVPRGRMRDLEQGIRTVEQAIKAAEDKQWSATDPEKTARADDMVGKLEKAVADLEAQLAKAQEAGDAKKVKRLEEDLSGRRAFLEMARRTAAELG